SYSFMVNFFQDKTLRLEPENNSPILTTIPATAYLEVIDENGPEQTISGKKAKWFKVNYDGKTGWAWGGLIKRVK
ncbi:SH3 domain-containing protein, partial [Pontibacter harenae]|uniref:SH3 domain-containing protein n=1 Tax=Pontibacter harenae TaxID=2894083 RepID=UPI001E3EFA08